MTPYPNPRALRLLLSCSLVALASCQYAGDRGMDFLDQYRISVGAGTVAGVRTKSLGLYDTGVMVGMKPKTTSLGWRYGRPLFFDSTDPHVDVDQAELVKTTSITNLHIKDGSYSSAQNSAALLPGLLTWADSTPTDYEWQVPEEGEDFVDRRWLWTPSSFVVNRRAQIHAFDVEFEVALGVYFDFGFSPGEMIDFLLGFILIDIAQDDGRLYGGSR